MTTKFSIKFKDKADSNLFQIIESPSSYQKEAVLAAAIELELRGLGNEKIAELKSNTKKQIDFSNKKKIKSNATKIPSDLPRSISNSSKLIYASIFLGIINPIIVHIVSGNQSFSNPINLIVILVSTGTLAFLGYNINLGKNWARIIFTVLCGLGLLMFPLVLPETFRLNLIVGILSTLQVILQGAAIILLFKSDSRTWYQNSK